MMPLYLTWSLPPPLYCKFWCFKIPATKQSSIRHKPCYAHADICRALKAHLYLLHTRKTESYWHSFFDIKKHVIVPQDLCFSE